MKKENISIEETHITLNTDLKTHKLYYFILRQRQELKNYIIQHEDFLISFEPVLIE